MFISLKDISLRFVVNHIIQIGRLYRHNVEALQRCAEIIHVLPSSLLQELYELTCHEIDLETSHVVLFLHSRLKKLDLHECISITIGFDLQMLLNCVGDNMKHLLSIRLPTGSKISPNVFERFCEKTPNLQNLSLYGVDVTDSMIQNLAATSSNIKCLDISNTPVTDVAIFNLCSQTSRLRLSITHLYVSQTCISDLGIMTALSMMPILQEVKFSGCIFQCLAKLHMPDFISNNIWKIPKYRLQILRSSYYSQLENYFVNIDRSVMELATIVCPEIKKIKIICSTHPTFSLECLFYFVRFNFLTHLVIEFTSKTCHNSMNLLAPTLELIGHRLINLKLIGISEQTSDVSTSWHFCFQNLTSMTFVSFHTSSVKHSTLLSLWCECPLLETLTVRHCFFFNDEVLNLIVNRNESRLRMLSLTDCNLSVDSIERLLNSSLPFERIILLNCVNDRDKQMLKSLVSKAKFNICIL